MLDAFMLACVPFSAVLCFAISFFSFRVRDSWPGAIFLAGGVILTYATLHHLFL